MKYIQRTSLLFLAALLVSGTIMVSSASAQRRISVGRGVVVHRVYAPRWNSGFYRGGGFGWGYDPYWSDPYNYDPRLRELADHVHNQNEVKKSARKIREYNEKYSADGYISEKEQKKIDKERRNYQKHLDRLNDGG